MSTPPHAAAAHTPLTSPMEQNPFAGKDPRKRVQRRFFGGGFRHHAGVILQRQGGEVGAPLRALEAYANGLVRTRLEWEEDRSDQASVRGGELVGVRMWCVCLCILHVKPVFLPIDIQHMRSRVRADDLP